MRTGRNVTVDPLAQAKLADDAKIEGVINLRTGEVSSARALIEGHTHEAMVKWRMSLREALYARAPRLACDLCGTPAYLVCSPTKAYFFRHVQEDNSCAAITRAGLSAEEIRARQYQGLRESEAHHRLKGLIEGSLRVDPAFNQIAVETTWRGSEGRRRPDVSARLGSLGLAFEGQLSTTFLSVVAARRHFYRQAGAVLVWILAAFDPDNRRMTEDDIVFPNNSNVLVVDESSRGASLAAGRFMVTCWSRRPRTEGSPREAQWDRTLAAFTDLTLDVEGQRAFLVDVAGIEATARVEAKARLEAARHALREEVLEFLEAEPVGEFDAQILVWRAYAERFARLGESFPESARRRSALQRWARLVRTARSGEVFGWSLKNLPQVAHHLHDLHPGLLYAFGKPLILSGHDATLRQQDHTGKWRAKIDRVRRLDPAGRAKFRFDATDLDTVLFLFPDTGAVLTPMMLDDMARA